MQPGAGPGETAAFTEPLPGYRRVYVSDPFQNRIELLEPLPAES